MASRSQLLSVVTHTPATILTRAETLAMLPKLAGGSDGADRFRSTVERSRIATRHVETSVQDLEHLGPGARSHIYERRVRVIAEDVGRRALDTAGIVGRDVSSVVTVSCTGYMMPSVDAYVMPRLGIPSHARRLPVTELGCSAGVGAIGIASDLVQVRGGHALVMTVELCSSCMQTTNLEASDVIGNILFADAAAAAVIGTETAHRGPDIMATRTVLWPETTSALGMRLSDTGLRLVLSPDLPTIVGQRIVQTVQEFLATAGLDLADVAFWVVHPGGPRVLEAVGDRLGLSAAVELAPSWDVWERYGNVSSATVFFILQTLRARACVPEGRFGVMMAFGPGLTCEMILLRAGGWLSDAC